MAKVVGDIAVEVSADIGPLQRELQKGTKATNKFGRDFNTTAQRMEKMAGKVTVAIGAITVAAGALGSAAQMVTQHAREIENLAKTAGVGVERFQSLTFAVREYGIESDKLSDILKDVNDKFGDFFTTGGGPLKDFFENIAPKVGVTADQFKRLSSADALGLYVKTLEEANVSQSEMTFYMEALANDATRLVPLLANNADEMKRLEQNAHDLGIVLSEELVDRTSRMATIWNKLVDSMRAKFVSFASTVLVGLDNIFGITDAGQLSNMREEMSGLADERLKLLNQIDDETARAQRSVVGNTDNGEIQRLRMAVEATEEEMNLINDGMLTIQNAAREREKAKADLEAALSDSGVGGGDTDTGGGGGGRSKEKDRFTDTDLEMLKDQFASERELIQEDYDEKLLMLNEFLEAKKISEDEYREYTEQAQREHNDRMDELDGRKRDAMLQGMAGVFGDLSSLMQAENKKLFQIGKAAAVAQATVSGIRAAIEAYEWGTERGGPAFGAIAAGASLAKTAVMISNLQSQSYGGGGGAASAGAIGGFGGGGTSAPANEQYYTVNLTGEGPIGRAGVRGLIEQLNEAIDDGAVLKGIVVNG